MEYERDELGNENHVDPRLEPELRLIKASNSLWIANNEKYARVFGDPIEEVKLPPGTRIIGQDDEGGFLVVNPQHRLW